MKFVIQKVLNASVTVENNVIGRIQKGLVVLIGIKQNDSKEIADYIINKLVRMRIFEDENDKMNLSINDVDGQILAISQFTLYADCTSGNRPSFIEAEKPERAKELYNYIIQELQSKVKHVATGSFGAHMQVSLVNDGPVTIVLEKDAV